MQYYIDRDGKQDGPFDAKQIMFLLQTGQASKETPIWYEGLSEWLPISALLDELQPRYTPPPQVRTQPVIESPCSRGVYIILAIFIGGLFGVHNFYAGHYGSAAFQLLLGIAGAITIGSFGTLIFIIIAIIVIIEVFTVTKDGKSRPFK